MHRRLRITQWRRGSIALLQAAVLATAALPANGQEVYPSKRLTMLVPYGAGSSTDTFARVVADGLARTTGQAVVAINRPGANGMIAVRSLTSTPADGYTFAILANGIIIDQVLKKSADFDVRKDLMPVARAVEAPMGVFVSNAIPANSIPELVDYARKNPGKVNYATSGVGSVGQLLTERFRLATGLTLVHVPYPGGNATIAPALMSGDVHIAFADIGSMRALASDKKIKFLATLGEERSPLFPQAPAISEVGMPELRGIFSPFFFGFFVASGTDPARVEKLATDINTTLQDPAVREKLVAMGYNAAALGGTRPADFRKVIVDELGRVELVVREAKITLE